MKIKGTDTIPNGLILSQGKETAFYEPLGQIKTIFNLRYNLFDKLKVMPTLINGGYHNLKNMFSSEDISILTKIYEEFDFRTNTKIFLKKIIEDNVVCYGDAPFKKINEILNLSNLRGKYTQRTYNTVTKWISLATLGTQKVKTIVNDKIYMPFPCDFNDRFDCQLHLQEKEMLSLGNNINQNVPAVKYLHALTKYSLLVSSFSLNDPLSTNSNHMWGLYGDNGNGFALIYELDELAIQICKNMIHKTNEDSFFFKPVNYVESYNPIDNFKLCLNEYYGKGNRQALIDFFEEFVLSKTHQWQFEQELRLYKFTLDAYKGFITEHGEKITNETCIELSKHMENLIPSINHELTFNKPVSIVLGWNCSTECENIQKIIHYAYAQNSPIKILKLDKYIDYYENKFYYSTLSDNIQAHKLL